jgi:hypothetical protein
MKQHITIDQLNELSDKGKERLREWWRPVAGDCVYEISFDMVDFTTEDCEGMWPQLSIILSDKQRHLPLLSIGQMIEFLVGTYGKRVDMDQVKDCSRDTSEWIVEAKHMSYHAEELCDALWESVKEILEK